MPFHHSFLSGGIDFSVFLNKFSYQPSLLYQSMLLGGGRCCMSNFSLSSCIALSFHTTRKNYSTLIHPFGRGLILYLYIHTFLSRISSIILHASLIPSFRKFHSTIHSFLEGMISRYFSIVPSIIFHRAINPCFWEGWMLHVNSSFFILHCSVIPCC